MSHALFKRSDWEKSIETRWKSLYDLDQLEEWFLTPPEEFKQKKVDHPQFWYENFPWQKPTLESLSLHLAPETQLEWNESIQGPGALIRRIHLHLNPRSQFHARRLISNIMCKEIWHVTLEKDAVFHLDLMGLGRQEESIETYTFIDHQHENSTSREQARFVLSGKSNAIYIPVLKTSAQSKNTKSTQQLKSIHLTQQNQSFLKPSLQISGAPLEASHGASVGSFNESEMKYLMQRGLSRKQIESHLSQAECQTLFKRAPMEAQRFLGTQLEVLYGMEP